MNCIWKQKNKIMEKRKKKLKITVLDDSSFYNRIVSKQLESYTHALSLDRGFDYSISSYAHADDFLRNLKPDTNIAFVDYYLGNGVTGDQVMKQIHQKCDNCKVVIISQARNKLSAVDTIIDGATAFIYKDINALAKSCFFVEHYANTNYSK